ncbi:Hypothetical protein R9X50_00131000 [Acrodontium crateriforme]|uniref:Uncharacterized protein n=1 Tax=Acrodontium crateriforme TaxID=150365 RepID=A0AAQ3M0J1_9PEZI|nr:Hypothetical protein R9X50_00131000 [Acrodontium crateriforme]
MGASESKLAFKEDVFRLAREDNIPADSSWWAQFYQLPESSDDVFALWSPNDVRSITLNGTDRPFPGGQVDPKKNLETLIYTCVARLKALQTRRCYPDVHHPIAPEILNCIRILTRLLPYIYESEHLNAWEERFFWQPRRPQQVYDTKHNRDGQYIDGLEPSKIIKQENGEQISTKEIGHPLGEELITILLDYMFFPSFTLPKRLNEKGEPELKVQYSIWVSGIGCRHSAGVTKENERNATEVVRLLLALCSKQLYVHPQSVADVDNKALTYITTQCDRQVSLSVVCSLLNTVLKYNPATWRVPINFAADGDVKMRLVNVSLQLLLVLVLYPAPQGETNAFRKAISRLHRVEDFQFIQQGMNLVLTQPISGMAAYLPGNQKIVPWAPELLVLFWELLQANKRFRSFIIETDRAHDFVVLVLYYAMDARQEPSKQGFVRMCVLILQTLSVESAFGMRLNKTFIGQESLPSVLRINNFHGTYADFLITSVHSLITTTKGRLESIYPALLAIILNIAPYVVELGRATSSKLMELFALLSSPPFLLEKESNHQLLGSLLQAMTAILEYHLKDNPRFVDVIVRGRQRFIALRDFTVEGALAELDRQAHARKDRASGNDSGVTTPARHPSIDSLRSPSTTLEHVPEHDAFAIGDDDDDEDGDNSQGASSSARMSSSMHDPTVPLQSRSMSEKARGKQPVGQGNFSRSAHGSRQSSVSSLPSLITTHTSHMQQFAATPEWLETWLPHLPLHTILTVIDNAIRQPIRPRAATAPSASPAIDAPNRPIEPTQTPLPQPSSPPKMQSFQWTSLSLGWYLSLMWGLIYASDIATNKGVNGIWTGTGIKIFNIASRSYDPISLRSPKGAVDAVGNTIVQRLGSFTFSGAGGANGAGQER